jgi:cytochrome c-type biogenesis protein CcmH/NrfF
MENAGRASPTWQYSLLKIGVKKMAKKKKRRPQQIKHQPVQQKTTNIWMITTIVAVVLLIGVSAKTMFSHRENSRAITPIQSAPGQPITIQPKTVVPTATTLPTNSAEDQVLQVAVNFKCACGGCGELPLAECQCEMPKGALEEKNFIRTKLAEGRTVPEVIELLDQEYGHRV